MYVWFYFEIKQKQNNKNNTNKILQNLLDKKFFK